MDEFYREIGKLETEAAPLNELEEKRIEEKVAAVCVPKKKKRRLVVLLAAAIIALTACTAVAVNYKDWFTFISSPNSEAVTQELFSDMGMVIGETVKDGETGVSMTLDGCLYDGERMALALTVTGVDVEKQNMLFANGSPEEAWLLSETAMERAETAYRDYGVEWTEETEAAVLENMKLFGGRPRSIYVVKMEEDTERLHLEIIDDLYVLGNAKSGDMMQFYLKDISYRGEVLIPGEFLFRFTLPERDLVRHYRGELTLETPLGTMAVSDIAVSPSSVQIRCDAPDAPEDKKSSARTLKRVRLQDGTTCGFGGAQFRAEDGRLTYLSGQYNDWQFISPAEVEAICIGEDAWIELSELEEYTPEEESTE